MSKINKFTHYTFIFLLTLILLKFLKNLITPDGFFFFQKSTLYVFVLFFIFLIYFLLVKIDFIKKNLLYFFSISLLMMMVLEIFLYFKFNKKKNYYQAHETIGNYINSENNFVNFGLKSKTEYAFEFCEKNTFITDKFGFINSNEDYEKSTFDIIILGPTLAHSDCGIARYDFSTIFRENNYSTISFNVIGTSILSNYATFKEYAKRFNSKFLILFLYEQHIQDLSEEIKFKELNKYLTNDNYKQDLFLKQNEVNESLFLPKENFATKPFSFKRFIKFHYLRLATIDELARNLDKRFWIKNNIDNNHSQINKDFYNKFEQILIKFKNELNKNQKFVTIYIPSKSNYSGKFSPILFNSEKIKEFLKLHSNLIDLSMNINDKNYNKFFVGMNHLSKKGQGKIFKIIQQQINQYE